MLVALLSCGSLLLSNASLGVGDSARFSEDCSIKLLDLSPTKARVELSCGSPLTAIMSVNESVDYGDYEISLEGVGGSRASFSFSQKTARKTMSASEAVEAARAFVGGYPADSLSVEKGDCDGRRALGACWVVSAHATVSVPEKQVFLDDRNVTLPSYSYLRGVIVFVDSRGSIVRLLQVT